MGVEISSIVGHSMTADQLRLLPIRMNDNLRLAEILTGIDRTTYGGPKLRRSLPKWKWDCDVTFTEPELQRIWRDSDQLDLTGPLQSLYFSRTLCHLSIWWIRYEYFLLDDEIQRLVRSMVACIHGIVNPNCSTPMALYVPDSAYPESRATDETQMSLNELCDWMHKQFGPPASQLKSIYNELDDGRYETRGYYIDRFEGFSAADAR